MATISQKDVMARNLVKSGYFKMLSSEAIRKELCCKCGESALPKCYSEAGKKEYFISALCEECFDRM